MILDTLALFVYITLAIAALIVAAGLSCIFFLSYAVTYYIRRYLPLPPDIKQER